MTTPARCRRPPSGRRPGVVLWLVLALIVQGVTMAYHATAMASGIEVCSADGAARRLDADGKPSNPAADAHEGCCAAPVGALPSSSVAITPPPRAGAARAELGPAAVIGAPWTGPLSRGPPTAS